MAKTYLWIEDEKEKQVIHFGQVLWNNFVRM